MSDDRLNGALKTFELSDEEFLRIRRLVYDYFGINLTDKKKSLVIGRLHKYLKRNKISSFKEYIGYLENDADGNAISDLIDRISTNYTFFFREKRQFDFISQRALPEIVERQLRLNEKDIRSWCAGCSGGDEPFSLLITLLEYFGESFGLWDTGILATDVSESALEEGKEGIYSSGRLTPLNRTQIKTYFDKVDETYYRVKDDLRKEILFRRLNLMNTSFPFKQGFDLILCRNVMIYFDSQTRERLVRLFYRMIKPGGYFFIGSSETIRGTDTDFRFIQPGIYKKESGI